jgi:hypothetical protein
VRRGQKDTIAALALGGGLIAIIAAIEARRGRAGAPVITHGRWSSAAERAPSHIGFDFLDDIADLTESLASAVASAIIDDSGGQLTDADRPSVIAVVMDAMRRYRPRGAA